MDTAPSYRLYKWVPNWGLPSISAACIQVEVTLCSRDITCSKPLCIAYSIFCSITNQILLGKITTCLACLLCRHIYGLAGYQSQQRSAQIQVPPLQVRPCHMSPLRASREQYNTITYSHIDPAGQLPALEHGLDLIEGEGDEFASARAITNYLQSHGSDLNAHLSAVQASRATSSPLLYQDLPH